MKIQKLPQQIIVTVDNDGTEEFLTVAESADDAAEQGVKKRGGIYVLKELITIEGVAKVSPGK